MRSTLTEKKNFSKPIDVLFEDTQYIVFNKPSGLLVIPSPHKEKRTLVNIVNAQFAAKENYGRLHPCHRLDRDTSGAIIFAKGKSHQQLLMQEFKQSRVKKRYIAFVHGHLPRLQGVFKTPVKHLEQRKFNRNSRAMSAVTEYKVKKKFKNFSVVEIFPLTGRTNQIRIHFSQNRHPLVGERKYAIAKDYPLRFRRVALHAHQLSVTNPVTKQKINVTVELPKDMEEFIGNNRN